MCIDPKIKEASAGDQGRGRSPGVSPTRTETGHTPGHTTLASSSKVGMNHDKLGTEEGSSASHRLCHRDNYNAKGVPHR